MRLAGFITVFLFVLAITTDVFAFSQPTRLELLKNPQRTVKETLKPGISAYSFFKALPSINTFTGFEKFFARQATHNPVVWRQGGSYLPSAVPRFYTVVGPPFDIHTPSGTIPGCLHQLCPPPQGALWVAGTCWCAQ